MQGTMGVAASILKAKAIWLKGAQRWETVVTAFLPTPAQPLPATPAVVMQITGYINGNNLVDQNSATNNGTNMNSCADCTFGANHAPS